MRRVVITDCITEKSLRDVKLWKSMRISPKLPYGFSSSKLPKSKIWKTSIFLFLSLLEAPLFLELYPVCWKTSSAELLPDGMGWHGSL